MTTPTEPEGFISSGAIADVDPSLDHALRLEDERQARKLVMIASESVAPLAVRQALGSTLTNIYAEGYPALRTIHVGEERIADVELQLAYHRRYGDRRYYKGTDFVNTVESIAQRRVAELFATDAVTASPVRVRPEDIHANVQALSGAAANNAVYTAVLKPGDTIMGMNLTQGGHLSHGSPVNRSGKLYNVVSYGVDPDTGLIDYASLAATAAEVRPRMVVAGASAYPWTIDWARLRAICESLPEPAYLLADIAHTAGLVVAGLFPNPVGIADFTTFTTHKTMIGPRAAVILTTDHFLADRVDRAVFPGEQGGPHVNTIAAMAVAFKLAQQPAFGRLQRQIVANAQALASAFVARGYTLAYGGTNTHLLLVDLRAVKTASGLPLNGDLVSRMLDVVGIVCNKNSIIGDTSAVYPSGLRFGTPWLTQRGLGPDDMAEIAEIVHRVIGSIDTFRYQGIRGTLIRGKSSHAVLADARRRVDALTARTSDRPAPRATVFASTGESAVLVSGPRAGVFLQSALTANVLSLEVGQTVASQVLAEAGGVVATVGVYRVRPAGQAWREDAFVLACESSRADSLLAWLRDLSDGYVRFDSDLLAKLDGPVAVEPCADAALVAPAVAALAGGAPAVAFGKPYFVGMASVADRPDGADLPQFVYGAQSATPRRTSLHSGHQQAHARMVPFAGWEMPVWYAGIGVEHQVVRQRAGLFDLGHMGVLEVSGPGAARFLDLVTTNFVPMLEPGKALYSYLLDPDGGVMDDILIYRRGADQFMVVVNAANEGKVWSWLQAVNAGECVIDRERPLVRVDAHPTIRDLKAPESGDARRIDLALQGPRSRDLLTSIIDEPILRRRVRQLGRFDFVEGDIAGVPALISRTGYTGEQFGYELYVHPERAAELWGILLARGEAFGVQPIGLGARDSLRTEAGFPLYGHELAGNLGISPMGAGYGGFVKYHKPWFIGRSASLAAEATRSRQIVRFRMREKGVRVVRTGDPVIDRNGECIGFVTSCAAVDGLQLGMAYIDRRASAEGTGLGIFPLGAGGRGHAEKARAELTPGDRVSVPVEATVLRRFR